MIKYKLQSYSEYFRRWNTIGIYNEDNIDIQLKLSRQTFHDLTFRKELLCSTSELHNG